MLVSSYNPLYSSRILLLTLHYRPEQGFSWTHLIKQFQSIWHMKTIRLKRSLIPIRALVTLTNHNIPDTESCKRSFHFNETIANKYDVANRIGYIMCWGHVPEWVIMLLRSVPKLQTSSSTPGESKTIVERPNKSIIIESFSSLYSFINTRYLWSELQSINF